MLVEVSTHPLKCADARLSGHGPQPGERFFQLAVAPGLGALAVSFSTSATTAPDADRAVGRATTRPAGRQACGDVPFGGQDEQSANGKDLKVVIAKEQLPIAGAIFYPDKQSVLLSTEPVSCRFGLASAGDVGLFLPTSAALASPFGGSS